jgi:hypothetical protein
LIRRHSFSLVCLLAAGPQAIAQTQPPAPPLAPTPTPKEKTPPLYDTSDGQISLAPFYWIDTAHPVMRTGALTPATDRPSELDYPGKNKRTPGAILSVPAGENNTIRISYFRMQGSGATTAPKDLKIFGGDYDKGTLIAPGYTMQNFKASLDYLSWPFPMKDRRFRFKTLWEVQYTSIQTTIHAPVLEAADASLSPTKKSNWFVYPTFGVGVEEMLTKHFRVEVKASGFAFPKRSTLWDGEGIAAYRAGQIEFFGGGKGFHFKTSPKREEYIKATLYGAFVGVRWYPKFWQ